MEQKTVLIMPNLSKYNTVWLMKAIIGQLRAAGCVPVTSDYCKTCTDSCT